MKLPKESTDFVFEFRFEASERKCIRFSHTVPIPLEEESLENYSLMLCALHNVPCYAKQEVGRQLGDFVDASTVAYFDELGNAAIRSVLESPDAPATLNALTLGWNEHRGPEVPPHPPCGGTRDGLERRGQAAESLEGVWKGLVDSGPDLARFSAKEARLQARLARLLRERQWELDRLQRKHNEVITKAVEHLETDGSGKESTEAASRHFAHINRVEENYESQIRILKEAQRRELRSFAAQLNDARVNGRTLPLEEEEMKAAKPELKPQASALAEEEEAVLLDESYTIYLGAQQKTMHNLRLTAMDGVAGLCRVAEGLGPELCQSRRLQLALDLYGSRNLSALVLLVQGRPHYHHTFRTPFYRAVEDSTEVHFLPLEQQLDLVAEHAARSTNEGVLSPGDCYVTRHSNLASVQLIFHLVVDDALATKEINSRHPCINGLRNIIGQCGKFGVGKLSLPVLLVERLGEEHTMQWCAKRVELVQKCVKGFLMEGAGSGTTYTLSFLLPPETPAPLFASLADSLPHIFHLVPTKS